MLRKKVQQLSIGPTLVDLVLIIEIASLQTCFLFKRMMPDFVSAVKRLAKICYVQSQITPFHIDSK